MDNKRQPGGSNCHPRTRVWSIVIHQVWTVQPPTHKVVYECAHSRVFLKGRTTKLASPQRHVWADGSHAPIPSAVKADTPQGRNLGLVIRTGYQVNATKCWERRVGSLDSGFGHHQSRRTSFDFIEGVASGKSSDKDEKEASKDRKRNNSPLLMTSIRRHTRVSLSPAACRATRNTSGHSYRLEDKTGKSKSGCKCSSSKFAGFPTLSHQGCIRLRFLPSDASDTSNSHLQP